MTKNELLVSTPVAGVLQVTLNRPHARNAITLDVQRRLDSVLAAAAVDDEVRVVVLAGAGDREFSSGYDIKEMAALSDDEMSSSMSERDSLLWRYFTFPKPTVAAIHGGCLGAGTLLAVCSDFRVGGPATMFTVTAARYGGANLTWILDSLVGTGRARDLLMTARTVDGAEAYQIGLLSRFAGDGDVRGHAVALAEVVAGQPAAAMAAIKSLLIEGPGRDLPSRFDNENCIARTSLAGASAELFSRFSTRLRRLTPGLP
jgi:2-(1,2-epoxy-1,2-dihydrophenyl)acetyl-CoA isomerase